MTIKLETQMMNNQIDRRDFFAATCTERELEERMPKTIGAIRDELIARGIMKSPPLDKFYEEKDCNKLRCILRFEYADEMIAVSNERNAKGYAQ